MDNKTPLNSTFSGFEQDISGVTLSHNFQDMEVVALRQYNILVKAQRDGKWWMLKAVKEEYRDSTVCINALQKEYDVMSQLQHPGIVKVEGYEEVDGLGPCIVMEYVSGDNLHDALQQGLSTSVRQRIARELIDVLGYVHRKQVVHRDIKPSNIMVQNNSGYIKLIDFGCSDGDSYTYLKQPSGTEEYISPEQRTASVADMRNDIYSLGKVLDELQLGRKYNKIIQKCLLPIDLRYQSIEQIKNSFEAVERHKPWRWFVIVAIALLTLVLTGIHYHLTDYIYAWAKDIQLTNYHFRQDGIYYNILSKDSCTVETTNNGYVNTYTDDITIPEYVEHNGTKYHVVRIGNDCFRQCDSLIAVVLPKSIRSIGNNAFMGSKHLATINLPDGITEMGDSAFRNCDLLRSVRFPLSMTEVPPYCFSGCGWVSNFNLHEGITAIRRDAFAGTGIHTIAFPHSLRTIERGAFWACFSLYTITIPETVTTIGDFVFWRCDQLRNVYTEHKTPLSITNIFQDLKDVRLHVPPGSRDAYINATGWNSLTIVSD